MQRGPMLTKSLFKQYGNCFCHNYRHIQSYLQESMRLRQHLLSLAHLGITTENDELVTILTMETFREHMASFVEMNKGRNPNFRFLWQ